MCVWKKKIQTGDKRGSNKRGKRGKKQRDDGKLKVGPRIDANKVRPWEIEDSETKKSRRYQKKDYIMHPHVYYFCTAICE